jgi:uncharacterized protein (DUF2062 family)
MNRMKMLWKRVWRGVIKAALGEGSGSAAYLGRTFAAGFFAGMLVPPGQTPIVLALWIVFDKWLGYRFNLIAACLLTLISNPTTTPMWYYLYYLTGQAMLGGRTMEFGAFVKRLKPLMASFSFDNIWESLALLAKGIGYPIMMGSLVWHVVMAFVGYFLGVWIYGRIQAVRKMRKAHRTHHLAANGTKKSEGEG